MTTQNAGEMTTQECRDWLAVNSGWRQINDPMAAKGTRRLVWFGATKTLRYGYHPIHATLDEAAILPKGWTWTIEPDYEASCAETRGQLWVAWDTNGRGRCSVPRTGDEKLDRFRLRVAVEMAERNKA